MCVAKEALDLHHSLKVMITGFFKGYPENDILTSLSGTQLALNGALKAQKESHCWQHTVYI